MFASLSTEKVVQIAFAAVGVPMLLRDAYSYRYDIPLRNGMGRNYRLFHAFLNISVQIALWYIMYTERITKSSIIASSILFRNHSDEVSGKGALQ